MNMKRPYIAPDILNVYKLNYDTAAQARTNDSVTRSKQNSEEHTLENLDISQNNNM